MSIKLVTYGADRRLELAAAESIRKPVYAGVFNTIRIGLQFSFGGVVGDIGGTPRLAFGICSGNTNVLVASTAQHVWGWRSNIATLSYDAGPPSSFHALGSSYQSYLKVGVTETISQPGANPNYGYTNDTSIRNVIFLEMQKTGTTSIKWIVPSSGTSAPNAGLIDITDDQFRIGMETTNFGDIGSAMGLIGYAESDLGGPTIDEATNGTLDNIFVYWERSSNPFSFNIRHRKMS